MIKHTFTFIEAGSKRRRHYEIFADNKREATEILRSKFYVEQILKCTTEK